MKAILGFIGGVCLLATGAVVQAATVSFGDLSYDNSGQIIQDTANNRNWIDFAGTGLTYSNLVTATQAGGAWEGWSIANNSDALLFVDALLGGSSSCVSTTGTSTCGNVSGWSDGALGASYGSTVDYFWFEDTVGSNDVGYAYFSGYDGRVLINNSWGTFASADAWVNPGSPSSSINYLIWQSATPAPAPASALLLISAAAGLMRRRRRA